MPIYRLSNDLAFPDPSFAEEDGLLALEGDLSPERLLLAYSNGIFPWFSEEEPILWWSPDPRFILYPKDIRISHSMKKTLKNNTYRVSFDTCFRDVISSCSNMRKETGTWITNEMIEAYCKLHELGFAHSVEAFYDDKLVGGLYGVCIGKCFFGESMFSTMDNASKAAFITLSKVLEAKGFIVIDCQVHTNHLESLGAVYISREDFLQVVQRGISIEPLKLHF
ncbi:leucyl/phenylalanyl-tRNA--protein transferase [Clostridium tagluense]|uniref:leucyl/phenylalanyl-tRNA--protein transferase n=1 Tax=Clostridium TaxID=1485 RepID=UPI0013E92A78|nr:MULTISPECIES: leucyl/phenylalanyl-tRNA--protein transferase [Clostridium]MBW9156479.1 leucyl/phenylalanyl-tRNA--protein transferase [Clostridium tagluense]MBZ9624234.1 leucyl/phenylalanyl-tRNA--protein transferase [Clostridium sp. FP2]MCB2309766.1 leucyl/phenylalanyl-tRNA--protein transferase [Clostridium tagluense]MCB2314704.1 leucyl/phenylalanyl-tRNA--protein transferase [Clostridium tagluense]MCB2319553.1 leucyl/phenylalanyl-tRNA--protein transferase [Clostridium tagluense]